MNDEPWYKTLFDDRYLRSYQSFLSSQDNTLQAGFLFRELRLEPGMRLLDLCCGQGRLAVPLALRGLRVTGQDLSRQLLDEAARAAREAGVAIELIERDMRDVHGAGDFDAAINMFTAFGYFDDDAENFRVLEGVSRALKPGGGFCIEILSYAWLMRHWVTQGWMEGDGGLITTDLRKMDWRRGVQTTERTLIERDGSRRTISIRLRLFPSHELVEWLRRAGLETESLFGNFDGSPYNAESPRLLIVARKK